MPSYNLYRSFHIGYKQLTAKSHESDAVPPRFYCVPNKVPKRFRLNEFSSDFAGQITDTKKPAGLAPCGLLGLHLMTLVITDGEFGGAGGS